MRTISVRPPALHLSPALLLAFGAAACAMSPIPQRHDWPNVPPVSLESRKPPVIVVGFLGGVVKDDDPIRSETKLAERLRAEYPSGVYVETFENRHREKALRAILTHLGADRSGLLSENEMRQARIILFGHSWGGSAMVELARELGKRGIPVLLTVQVDSVKRFGQDDGVIPPNVARAVNFYQPNGVIHGRSEIRAADPARTQILGTIEPLRRLMLRLNATPPSGFELKRSFGNSSRRTPHSKIDSYERLQTAWQSIARNKYPALLVFRFD